MNPSMMLKLIPAAVSLFAGNKKPSGGGSAGSVSTQPNMPEWQYGLGENLSGWASKFLNMYNPGEAYGGKMTAGSTGMEQTGLAELQKLLSQPATGDLFGAAKTQVMDTLDGKYADPNTSPFIQSYTKLAQQNLGDAVNTSRGQRGARGTYFTKAGIQEESQLAERTQNYLNTMIGDFLNTERGRQFSAAGMAKDLEGFSTDQSIKRVEASQNLGGLERMIEQADLESKYDAWLNQRTELSGVPGVASNLFSKQIPLDTINKPVGSPSVNGADVAPWVSMAMQVLPMLMK